MHNIKHKTSSTTQDQHREPLEPKLWSVLAEGYGLARLRRDAVAGLTVAIVALPLSMAIAIASGLPPERGLFTAIVGGFIISALGGSRFQIGGPAGAFIVLVAAILQRHGYDGLLLATAMAGTMMAVLGFLRLGTLIRLVPFPVTVGFMAGIAVVIFASQIKDLLGLTLVTEPAALLPKLAALWSTLGTVNPRAVALSAASIAAILALRRWRPQWPGLLIAVVAASLVAGLLALDVATIGTRFGGVPRTLPSPSFPELTLAKMWAVLPDAMAIALLGAIESLLSAVVADGMTGRRHRSNIELVAQGVANIAASIFGGMPATGTIARTATNIRSGSTSPISGMLHAVYLLLFMLIAAPLASHIPLAVLAAVLAIVAWNMVEAHEVFRLLRASWADALVVITTFLLTVLIDLTAGIAGGIALGILVFLARVAAGLPRHSTENPVD
jgi:sulfate permease, SulP family